MEQTDQVVLEVTAPASALRERLLAVDGVRHVDVQQAAADGKLTAVCQIDTGRGAEAAIARAVAAHWDLHHLERRQPTLEAIFLRYVRGAPDRGEAAA